MAKPEEVPWGRRKDAEVGVAVVTLDIAGEAASGPRLFPLFASLRLCVRIFFSI
jgi:hypothetical protein